MACDLFRAVLALALCIPCFPGWSQIRLEQVTRCGPGIFPGTGCSIPATRRGDLIVIGWQSDGGTAANTMMRITDNAGNVYVEAGAVRSADATELDWADIWYAKNSKTGATAVTVTPSLSDTGAAVIWEFSGVDPYSPLDQVAVLNSQPDSTAPKGAPVTLRHANELIVSIANMAYESRGTPPGNGFTNDSNLLEGGWAHLIASSPGLYAAQWNQNRPGTFASSTISFRAAGPPNPCDLNADGSVDIEDVRLATREAMGGNGAPACRAPEGLCTMAYVRAVLVSARGGECVLPVIRGPASVSFDDVVVGHTSTRTVTLTGSGVSATTISQADVSGRGFSIRNLELPLTVPAGQSARFDVTFTPASVGASSGRIVFVTNALNPFELSLTASGVAP